MLSMEGQIPPAKSPPGGRAQDLEPMGQSPLSLGHCPLFLPAASLCAFHFRTVHW